MSDERTKLAEAMWADDNIWKGSDGCFDHDDTVAAIEAFLTARDVKVGDIDARVAKAVAAEREACLAAIRIKFIHGFDGDKHDTPSRAWAFAMRTCKDAIRARTEQHDTDGGGPNDPNGSGDEVKMCQESECENEATHSNSTLCMGCYLGKHV